MKRSLCLASITLFSLLSSQAFAKSLDDVRWKALPGTVALTFDDGPTPEDTPKIIAILKKYHVPATFFVMGWSARKYPELIKAEVANGDAVASHTMSHPMLTKISDKQLHYEITKPKEIITAVIGKPPVCVRPPFGMGNKKVGDYIRSQGMIMVPMGFNTFDYTRPGVEKLTSWTLKNAHSGTVFLMHDGPKFRDQTIAALPAIIEGIRKKGLGFSAICYP